MKSFRQLCSAVVLTLMLALTVLAGDIQTPTSAVRGDIDSPGRAGDIGSPGIKGDMGNPGIAGEIGSPGIAAGMVTFFFSLF